MDNTTLTATAVILTGKAPVVVGTLALIGAGTLAWGTLNVLAWANGYRVNTLFSKPRKI